MMGPDPKNSPAVKLIKNRRPDGEIFSKLYLNIALKRQSSVLPDL